MNAVGHGFTTVVDPDFAAAFEDALKLDEGQQSEEEEEHVEEPDEAHHATTTTLASSAPVNGKEEKREALATTSARPETIGRGHPSDKGRGRGQSTGRGGRRRHHHHRQPQPSQYNIHAQPWAPHMHQQFHGSLGLLETRPPFVDPRYAQQHPLWLQQQYMASMMRPPLMMQQPPYQHLPSPLHRATGQKEDEKRK